MKRTLCYTVCALTVLVFAISALGGETVKIGLNYPATGPYSVQGLDQLRAAELAVEEINAAGGILGNQVVLVTRDSKSNVDQTKTNVTELIDSEGCAMVFGGSSSAVAIAAGEICQQKGVPFFGTLTYSTSTTGARAHRYVFRECYDSWMAANALADYLKSNYPGKKYMYITADYTWGWTTEASMRKLTGTDDVEAHKGLLTPLGTTDFGKELGLAKIVKPDVLVLVLFGKDMVNAVRQATTMGLKANTQIVVPNLTLGMAEGGGAKVMEGVVGALPWCWKVPYAYDYPRGKKFVEDYAARHQRYPSTSGASAYTILYEYKSAAERAGSIAGGEIVNALENHSYQLLKDKQTWRDFDHQSIQTVYAVRCKPQAEVLKDKYGLDYFEILTSLDGTQAAISKQEWEAARVEAGLPTTLEPTTSMVGQ
ncbi:ABC transporter substrate-binding protein [candidate division GN15 bacterium]|nr:ABC transporter substrate-binding protein [candidate division GN15 bacterium]